MAGAFDLADFLVTLVVARFWDPDLDLLAFDLVPALADLDLLVVRDLDLDLLFESFFFWGLAEPRLVLELLRVVEDLADVFLAIRVFGLCFPLIFALI